MWIWMWMWMSRHYSCHVTGEHSSWVWPSQSQKVNKQFESRIASQRTWDSHMGHETWGSKRQWQLCIRLQFVFLFVFLSSCGMWQLNEFIYTWLLINWTRCETRVRLFPSLCVRMCVSYTHTHIVMSSKMLQFSHFTFHIFESFVTLRRAICM